MQAKYLLFESASGYSLFDVKAVDGVALSTDAVQQSISDMSRFSKIASLVAFKPFSTAADALEQINCVSESLTTEMLVTFLTSNLPKVKDGKKAKWKLGVVDPKLANAISEEASAPCMHNYCIASLFCALRMYSQHFFDVTGIPCVSDKVVTELARGVRMHFSHYVKQLEEHTWRDAQRGLAHSYSRAKVKFNVNRVDNMIIQVCVCRFMSLCVVSTMFGLI